MLRKIINDRGGLVTDGWISIDPSEAAVIERVFKKTIHEGEKELMMAVLQDAVECFQTYVLSGRPREKRLFQEAEDWILEKNSDWFFSFENICAALEFDPNYLRHGLAQAKARLVMQPMNRESGGTHTPTKKGYKKKKYRLAA